jgi:hypothetical protein
MSVPNKPPDSTDDGADAEFVHPLDRFRSALDRGDLEELALALGQLADPACPAPARRRRPNDK